MTTTDDRPTSQARTIRDLPYVEPEWRLHARCIGAPFAWFAVGHKSKARTGNSLKARALCAACPVVTECRVDACRADDRASIRGGMSVRERDDWLEEQGYRRLRPRELDLAAVARLKEAGLSFAEIGRQLDVTPDMVQQQWYRAGLSTPRRSS